MKLRLFFDHRFVRGDSGSVFSQTSYNYDLLAERYLSVFDELEVIARVADTNGVSRDGRNAEGPNIAVTSLGNWKGPRQYFRRKADIQSLIRDAIQGDLAIMLIAPGTVGGVARRNLDKARPYGMEVIGDPNEVFASGSSQHPLRSLVRMWATREMRMQCKNASTISYVNTTQLPQRYPAPDAMFQTNYSSIELRAKHFVDRPRAPFDPDESLNMITIGSLAVPYKGVDTLLYAHQLLLSRYPKARLTVIGDGQHQAALERQANELGIADSVVFLGRLPAGNAVREQLRKADLFVLASRTEGLPRVLIEAMAQGLPSIGTNVGGIPELLSQDYLVSPNDPISLANKIDDVVNDRDRLARMSVENLLKARGYRSDVLQARRVAHYSALKEATLEWQGRAKY